MSDVNYYIYSAVAVLSVGLYACTDQMQMLSDFYEQCLYKSAQ